MGIVIRTSRSKVHQRNIHLLQQREELHRFAKVGLGGILRVHAETPAIRQEGLIRLRDSWSQLIRRRKLGIGTEWHCIEGRNSYPTLESGCKRMNSLNNFP